MADSSGQGPLGSYNLSTSLGQLGAISGDPDAAIYDNSCCNVGYATPSLQVFNAARTVEAWVKPSDGNFRYLLGWGAGGPAQSYNLAVTGTSVNVVTNSDDLSWTTPGSLVDGSWHHVVVSYDGSRAVAYIDGTSLGAQAFAAPLDTINASGLYVGANYGSGGPVYGYLDEVAVYPVALSAGQVQGHFHLRATTAGPTTGGHT
jgi:hypothetical protein